MKLRPYQEEARQAVFKNWEQGNKRTLLVLPTGTGKTIVFAKTAEECVRRGERVLILAHRGELLDQAADKIKNATGLLCAKEKAEESCLSSWYRITVGSVQSLMREKRLSEFPEDYFSDIIIDEAHHSVSDSYQKILKHFRDANVLGVTATPDRGDMRNLGQYFDSLAYEYTLPQAMRNSDITAQDLIDQSVVDYAASSVYFPMIQLHPNIGCDLPDTVQLCRNRLVWACSDGNVYTLMSEDQYSERNIYCISDMIKRKLKNETGKAYSADWNGHYMLFYGSHIYVMNYESYGYVYASSYNKTSDAQLMIPWWYWELPESSVPQTVFVCAGAPLLVFSSSAAGTLTVSVFDERTFTDNTGEKKEIPSMFVTKIFDFGAPHYFKNVTLINAAFGNNGARPISTFFVTEQGEEESETLMLTESGEDEYSPDFVHNRQLRPSLGPINRIGFKAECTGYMSLDSISLYYRLLGGAR